MIYAELLRRFPTIVTNNHPNILIRYNLNGAISHCLHGGELFGDDECTHKIQAVSVFNERPRRLPLRIANKYSFVCGYWKYIVIERADTRLTWCRRATIGGAC
jgi:hypothetical protein